MRRLTGIALTAVTVAVLAVSCSSCRTVHLGGRAAPVGCGRGAVWVGVPTPRAWPTSGACEPVRSVAYPLAAAARGIAGDCAPGRGRVWEQVPNERNGYGGDILADCWPGPGRPVPGTRHPTYN